MNDDYHLLRASEPGWRQKLRVPVMVAGTLLYGSVVGSAVWFGWPHYEWLAILLQGTLLLPSLLYGLRGTGDCQPPKPEWQRPGLWTAVAIGVFLAVSAVVSAFTLKGVSIPDESAYRFQARILRTGHLMAQAPPGAPNIPEAAPTPLAFNHTIVWRKGWFAKYPLGWPLVLALPEGLGLEWLVNPLLAVCILMFTASIARSLGGPMVAFWAVALLVLSPCFLAPTVELMSHTLAGVLVAASCWAWMRGASAQKVAYFCLTYGLIGLAFHVRPYTALLAAVTLTAGTVCALRRDRAFLARVLAIGCGLGVLTVGSVLLYNWTFTGRAWVSPYALSLGVSVPREITPSMHELLEAMASFWRFEAQSTLTFFFPLIFVLAGVGIWKNWRKSPIVVLLPALFLVTVVGYLVETIPSASVLAERFWFEVYFAVAIPAAQGIAVVVSALQTPRKALVAGGVALLAVQAIVTGGAIRIMMRRSGPSTAVSRAATPYRDCRCVVFLKSSPPFFYGEHLNLNDPDWRRAGAFYAVDPGPNQRVAWMRTLGRDRFVVLTYDPLRGVGQRVE